MTGVAYGGFVQQTERIVRYAAKIKIIGSIDCGATQDSPVRSDGHTVAAGITKISVRTKLACIGYMIPKIRHIAEIHLPSISQLDFEAVPGR